MFCGFLEAYKQFQGLKKNNLRTIITNPLTPPAIKMWCPKSGWKKLDINIHPFIICPSLEACWMSWTLKINIKPSQISGVLQFSSSQRPSPTPETKKISDFFILLPSLGGGRRDNRAGTELGFAHVTTKTWAYLGVFGFLRFFLVINLAPRSNHILKFNWKYFFLHF